MVTSLMRACSGWGATPRRAPAGRSRSIRATSSAGISYSASSRHANQTKVAKAPIEADDRHPPDVPDQREADQRRRRRR